MNTESASDERYLGHPIQTLCGIVEPDARIVDSATIAAWNVAENRVQQARNKAAQRIKEGRRQARDNRLKLKQILEARFDALQQQWQQDSERARQEALSSSLRWMVDEALLEEKLYQQALSTACDWALKALQTWEDSIDWSVLLAARVNDMQHILVRERDLTVRLPRGEFAQQFLQDNQSKVNDGSVPLRVIIDDQLSERQATIGNALVEVTVDLHQEFNDVMAQLGHVLRHVATNSGD